MSVAVSGSVTKVEPIQNADRIRRADVDCGEFGQWSGVVGLDVSEGQSVSVFLQDAVLPADERWAFMSKSGWRVKMARFRGVPSECVIVPIPAGAPGACLMERYGVTKFQKTIPAKMAGQAKGNFPALIPKTDEPNFQSAYRLIEKMEGRGWVATIKYDGTSCTVWKDEAGLHACSRNWELKEDESVYWRAARELSERVELLPGVAYQMEVFGAGIQKNPMGADSTQWRVFTLYDFANHVRLPLDYDQPWTVDVVARGSGLLTKDQMREIAESTKYANGSPAEGVVIRDESTSGGVFSFKAISLKYKD